MFFVKINKFSAEGSKIHELFDLQSSQFALTNSPFLGFQHQIFPDRVPPCPNNLLPMIYSNGRPVMCLPGKNQCPDNSVCYFSGLDFYCCPNEDDPYDKHIFGGNLFKNSIGYCCFLSHSI